MKYFYKKKTFRIFLFVFLLFASGIVNAQMGIGTKSPAPSAQLDITSTSKGFLPPRMSLAERNNITKPAAGLMIWCSDCGASGEIQVYNGIVWTNMVGGAARDISISIGTQAWIQRNLDVTTYRNGDTIPEVTDPEKWRNLTTGAWCYYNNDPANEAVYGKLYNRYAIMDPRGLAPLGWHIPDNREWGELSDYLGGESSAAIKMRAAALWNFPVSGATNESGFNGLPGGYRTAAGLFSSVTNGAYWWSSSSVEYTPHDYPPPYDIINYYFLLNEGFNSQSFFYSEQTGFSVRCIRDIPGIKIGTQEWAIKNLDVPTYKNGDPITQVTDPAQWATITTGAWCYYNNDPASEAEYGRLYNWYAINDPRGIAPAGWHVANDAEYATLINYLGGEKIAGDKLKEKGTAHWSAPNAGATNESGFTALPGGKREPNGTFRSFGNVASWWTSSERNTSNAWYYEVNFYYGDIYRWDYKKQSGYSVRCIKD